MEKIAPALLDWFYRNRRSLPFRDDPTPYHIWVSEIMLQQTRVAAALPYYERFIRELPDIPALAACPPERLDKLWEGLGYYRRVHSMQKAAQQVCRQYGGHLPASYDALLALPGIGPYTAGAIASIGFGLAAPAVDGNVLRVFARLYNDSGPITDPAVKKRFTQRVMEHQPPDAPGDYNQALMELGALVCLPGGAPLCAQCPLAALCEGRKAGAAEALPCKAAPKPRRVLPVTVALVQNAATGEWLLQKRPEGGLLAGLWQPPAFEGRLLDGPAVRQALAALGLDPGSGGPAPLPAAKHIFTHCGVADERLAAHCAGPARPRRLRLGGPRRPRRPLRPARRVQSLPQISAGSIEILAFPVVILLRCGYNRDIPGVCADAAPAG